MKRLVLVAVLSAAAVARAEGPDPFTGGSAEAGAGKAAPCVACHGPGGNSSNPDWPKLAGQHATYTLRSLQVLKSGERVAPLMNPQAKPLSDQDMKDLAAYFATQKAQPGVASPDAVKIAESIYRGGDASRSLPACASCHGPEGKGNAGAGYPQIGGQHAKYAAAMLRNYRGRTNLPLSNPQTLMMAEVAAKLSDQEIEALASYINGLH